MDEGPNNVPTCASPAARLRRFGDQPAGWESTSQRPHWPARLQEHVIVDSPYHFVIADDHPLFRGALREAVSSLFGNATIAEAGSFDDASALLDKGGDVDLVLLD